MSSLSMLGSFHCVLCVLCVEKPGGFGNLHRVTQDLPGPSVAKHVGAKQKLPLQVVLFQIIVTIH